MSALVHVGWRCRRGTPTAIPAGILVTLVAVAALSFMFTSESHYPPLLHVHIALGLLAMGLVFLRHPREVPDRGLAVIAVFVGSSMVHGLLAFSFDRPSDAVLLSGGVALLGGCAGLLVVVLGNGRFSSFRRHSFELIALGAVLFSLGNLTAYQIAEDPGYAITSLFAACLTLLTANAIMRVRDVC